MNTKVSQLARPPQPLAHPSLAQSIAGIEADLAQTKAQLNDAEIEVIRLRQQLQTTQQDYQQRLSEIEEAHRNRVTELESAFVKRIDALTGERDGAKLHNAEVNARLRDCANRLLDIWNDDEKFHRYRDQFPNSKVNSHSLEQQLIASTK